MIYVDEMRVSGPPWHYRGTCHLFASTDAELESFARRLKLRLDWRHGDHYDLTRNKRAQAVKLGAQPVTVRELVRLRRQRDGGEYG